MITQISTLPVSQPTPTFFSSKTENWPDYKKPSFCGINLLYY